MFYFIINPVSGTGKGGGVWQSLRGELNRKKVDYRYYFTSAERNAGRIVRCILKKDTGNVTVVLLGGDGSVNELLQGVGSCGKETFERFRLGYIPAGSGGDLARGLDLQDDPMTVLKRILAAGDGKLSYMDGVPKAKERRIDLGLLRYENAQQKEWNGKQRYFAVSAGIGFDAAVCAEASASGVKKAFNRIGLGGLCYGFICVKRLLGAPGAECTLIMDRKRIAKGQDCLFAAIMNHKYQGGGVMFAPEASDEDGMLDLCYTDRLGRLKLLCTFPKAYSGAHVGTKGIELDKAKEMRIAFNHYLWVHTDGETVTRAKELTAVCLPGRLRLLV